MGFPPWTTEPIPGVSLSAGGLLALADLSTIAQRTAIAGGSSWLDSLILVPGLHYNQAADQLTGSGTGHAGSAAPTGLLSAVETLQDGQSVTFPVRNAATANYIRRIARPGQTVTLDVGCLPAARPRFRLKRSRSGGHATLYADDDGMPDLGWLSHVLYLASPVLTLVAFAFILLLRDWWSLASLLGLMLARVLNIWVIKQRATKTEPPPPAQPPPLPSTSSSSHHSSSTSPSPPPPPPPSPPPRRLTEYLISLDPSGAGSAQIRLRGHPADLAAITSQAWLRAQTHAEGYLEAAAKLAVYLVAALSGNMTQAGAVVFMALLLLSAALLALSNAHARGYRMNGRRVAALPVPPGEGESAGRGRRREKGKDVVEGVKEEEEERYSVVEVGGRGEEEDGKTSSWPESSDVSALTGMDDRAEKGQARPRVGDGRPF